MNKLYIIVIALLSFCSCNNKAPKDVDLNDRSKIERLIKDKCYESKIDVTEIKYLRDIDYSVIKDSIIHLRDKYLSSLNKVKYDSLTSKILSNYKDIKRTFDDIENSENKGIVSEYEITATNKLYGNYYVYVSKKFEDMIIEIRDEQIQNFYNLYLKNLPGIFHINDIDVLESDIKLLEELCKLDSTQLLAYIDSKKTNYEKPWYPYTWDDINKHYKESGYSIIGVWKFSGKGYFFVIFRHNNEYRYAITEFCENPFDNSSEEPMKKISSTKFEYNQGDSDMPERFVLNGKKLDMYTYNPDCKSSNKWVYMGSYDKVYP